jgi:transcriptional regulator with XRE-family HTH domain
MMKFGKWLKSAREFHGLTLEELAEIVMNVLINSTRRDDET